MIPSQKCVFPRGLEKMDIPIAGFFEENPLVKIPSADYAILGQPRLNALHVVVYTYLLLMKFLTMHRVGEVCRNLTLVKQCYLVFHKAKP